MNSKFSIEGYKDSSPDRNNSANMIPGNLITMKGVSKALTLIPIVGGKPQYDRQIVANPGDDDIQFESDVESVLELPYAQYQNPVVGGNIQNPYGAQGVIPGNNFAFNNTNNPNTLSYEPLSINNRPKTSFSQHLTNQGEFQGTPTYNDNLKVGDFGYDVQNSAKVNDIMKQGEKDMTSGQLDPNLRQQIQANNTTKQGQQGVPFMGAINPYGGWNLSNASTMLGASIQQGNTLGIIGSAGKILLEGTRNAMGGAAAMKRYQEDKNTYEQNLEEAERKQGRRWFKSGGLTEFFQKGGRLGQMLTGNFIEGNDNHSMPNVEVESGEHLQTPDGSVMEVIGKRHSEGGELLNVPEGTKVISDYLKIGSKLATFFKKEYDINVKAGSTFATVLSQYRKKIGLTELLEKESDLMEKILDQEDVKFEGSREINLQVLSGKVNELQPQKEQLDSMFENFTNLVFEKQEQSKEPEGPNFEKQTGGEVVDETVVSEDGQPIPQQSEQQDSSGIEQLIIAYSQLTGQDPAQIVEQLQQMPEEQIQQALEQMAQEIQSQQQGQPQEQNIEYAQVGLRTRNKKISNEYDDLPFAAVNVDGITDYDLQHYNNVTGTYDAFNPYLRLRNYMTDVPVGAENYFELKKDGTYGLQSGKTYADFQRGYNGLVDRTDKFFRTLTEGMSESEKKNYLDNLTKYKNDIIFTTDKESEYKGKTARGIDNKFGQFTSTRSGYVRNIIPEDKLKQLESKGIYKLSQVLNNSEAQKIIGDDLYNQMTKENKDAGGIDYRLAPLEVDNTSSTETSAETSAETSTKTQNVQPAPQRRARDFNSNLPLLVPDQSNLPPNLLQPGLRQVGSVQANAIRVSPEETIRELNRQYSTASTLSSQTNPYTSGAMQANLQAQTNSAINQAYSQAAIVNAQDQRNVENVNEERIRQRDVTNLGMLDQYEQRSQTALDNYVQSWRNFIDKRNLENVANYNLQQQVNASNAVNPNYQIGAMGQIYQTEESPVFYLPDGTPMYKDPQTGQISEITTKTDNKGNSTVTQKQGTYQNTRMNNNSSKKQKGGLLLSKNIKNLLK